MKRCVYDGEHILLEYDGTNALVARYTHGPGIDNPLMVRRGGGHWFFHTDGTNSVRLMTDAGGNVVQGMDYNAFGQIVLEAGAPASPFAFTGREFDPETGLYFYRARYYDPDAGRFVSEDPINIAGSYANLYTYVFNNPVNFSDPAGLWGISSLAGGIVGGIWGAVTGGITGGLRGAVSGAIGGAISGALIGSGLHPAIAGAVGGAANSFANQLLAGNNPFKPKNIFKTVVGAGVGAGFGAIGSAFSNSAAAQIVVGIGAGGASGAGKTIIDAVTGAGGAVERLGKKRAEQIMDAIKTK